MAVYNYEALGSDGKGVSGVIDADSPQDARLKLRSRKLYVTKLVEIKTGEKASESTRFALSSLRGHMIQEVAVVTRQLSTLLSSGISLMGALTAVIEQEENYHLKGVLMDIRERVSQGAMLSDALAANPFYFNDLYVNMVRAGESSGNLDSVLHRIADYLQIQSRIHARVVAALTYPIIMIIVATTVVLFLLTFVVPKIVEILQKQQKALPLPTDILIKTSDFLKTSWLAILLVIVIIYLIYKKFSKTKKGRLIIDTFLLKMPVMGQLIKKHAISRFSITLSVLLESGLPVLVSLDIVKKVVNNKLLEDTIEIVRKKISSGSDIATPIKNSKIFPPVVGYMIAVGEESGRLEELLRRISEAYDEEIEIASQKLIALLEPAIIIVMALVVAFIVLSIILPILQIAKI